MARRGETIQDILLHLGCRTRPDRDGNYKCRCPAHADKQASLSICEGQKGIVMKCFAGCSVDAICDHLGIKPVDLFFEDAGVIKKGEARRTTKGTGQTSAKAAPKAAKGAKTFQSYEDAYGWLGKVAKVYPYTTADGRLVFEVARIETPDGKTFRQHRPANPDEGKFPIVCNVPGEISGGVIYRLPEVVAGIAAGKPIYVVEGEKDADTLSALGRVATTCAGGAKNWRRQHSENLRGADVIVIPDNDESGAEHERLVLEHSRGIARRTVAVHLIDAWPTLPPKGDITDLVEAVGSARALEMLDKLTDEAARNPYQRAVEAYNSLSGYCIDEGCICQLSERSKKVLATFVALPIKEVTIDDGLRESKELEIMGWTTSGRRLKTIRVDVSKYKNLDWAMENWGLTANIMPGNTIRDKLRSAIMAAGVQVAKQEVIYQHTGWRKIHGQWVFLYQGGCIGMDNVTVDMGPGLENYTLDDIPDSVEAIDAATTSMLLEYNLAKSVSVPMLGITYLAPLREFLMQSGSTPSFAVVLKGGTGTRKSTAAALFLSHFGQFTNQTLPASFSDTANYVRSKAFRLKDQPIVVDDYYPATGRDEKRKMQQVAQMLSRTFGDNRERGRLMSDLTIQRSQPPRSMGIITGELVPDIGESGVGRFYLIEVGPTSIPANDALTDMQTRARNGELRLAMRNYIEWLIPQAEGLGKRLGGMFYEYRAKASKALEGAGAHARTPEQAAYIMIGLTMMLEHWISLGLASDEGKDDKLEEYWGIVIGNSQAQAEITKDDQPVRMFMTAIQEMLASKKAAVMDITPIDGKASAPKDMIGYVDQANYYLLPDTAYGAVVAFYANQERLMPGNRVELFRQLKAQKIIEQTGGDGKTTRLKRTPDGKNQRLLWIPRWKIDGGDAPVPKGKQEHMDFTEDDDPDLPDSFKS